MMMSAQSPNGSDASAKMEKAKLFPEKLFDMLDNHDLAHLVCWSDAGDSLVILEEENFTAVLLPTYFTAIKFARYAHVLVDLFSIVLRISFQIMDLLASISTEREAKQGENTAILTF